MIPSAIMQITTDYEHSLSLEKENQFHNEVYENLLAQKMQSLRYQCKLYLQICAIMSQLNRHRDALIFGQKSAQLCYQLIKDAQLLCKRQLAQIQRQTMKREHTSNDQKSDSRNHVILETAYDNQSNLSSNLGYNHHTTQISHYNDVKMPKSQSKTADQNRSRAHSEHQGEIAEREHRKKRKIIELCQKQKEREDSGKRQCNTKLESPRKSLSSKSEKCSGSSKSQQIRLEDKAQVRTAQVTPRNGSRRHHDEKANAYLQDDKSRSFAGSSNSHNSSNSHQSMSRIRIRAAFDLRSQRSKTSQTSQASRRSRMSVKEHGRVSQ